jgi:hypothetical protein
MARFARQKLNARAGKKGWGWGGEGILPAFAFRIQFFSAAEFCASETGAPNKFSKSLKILF